MGRTRLRWTVVAIVVGWLFASAASAEVVEAGGRVGEVTVYRGQALVTRLIPVELPAGLSEVVVPDLPRYVVPESLFANAGRGVDVRAVRYRTHAVREEPREAVREIDSQMEELQHQIEHNQMLQQVAKHASAYLGKLEQFVAPTAQTELTKGVLNAETLKALTLFMLEQHSHQSERLLELRVGERNLKRELDLLKRKRAQLTAGSSRTVRQAILFLNAAKAGTTEVRLSYVVTNASWEPIYNVRARTGKGNIELEYNAAVFQMSGEEWQDVELALSTASPALMASGPELAPFWVSLSERPPEAAKGREVLTRQFVDVQEELGRQVQIAQAAPAPREAKDALWQMNIYANAMQNLELIADKEAFRMARTARPAVAEGISVAYRLPGRISLASRSDKQLVRIAKPELKSEFYYVATPVLTGYVYRQAEIANESALSMLEGPATVYLDGSFVGKSRVPMVARGQRFTMGFGLDPQLRATREMVDRTEDTMGANREIGFEYRLAVENYKDAPVEVRLYDRLPYATGRADIRVTLGEMTDELSEDPLYAQRERPKGMLRWDVKVPGRAAGAKARQVEYAYKLEFDRRLHVVTPVAPGAKAPAELEREFYELQRFRRLAQ